MNREKRIRKKIEAIDLKLVCIHEMAKGMAKEMENSLDINLVLNFIDIKDIKKAKQTSNKLNSVFEERDIVGIMTFSACNIDSIVNIKVDDLNPSEGLCLLGMLNTMLTKQKEALTSEIELSVQI